VNNSSDIMVMPQRAAFQVSARRFCYLRELYDLGSYPSEGQCGLPWLQQNSDCASIDYLSTSLVARAVLNFPPRQPTNRRLLESPVSALNPLSGVEARIPPFSFR